MARGSDTAARSGRAVAVLLVVAFLAPGAWFVTQLPPQPIAKALTLVSAGVWLAVAGLTGVSAMRVDRRVLIGTAAVLAVVTASYIAAGSLYQVAFFDLFADMPLVSWLVFPLVFVLAAGLALDRVWLTRGLGAVVALGTALSAVMAVQQLTTGASHVFGSTAYSMTALVPLVPLAVGLAASSRQPLRIVWYACAAIVAGVLAIVSGSMTGAAAVLFAVLVTLAAHPAVARPLRRAAAVLAALAVVAVLVAEVPALSSAWVNPTSTARFDKNVVTRVYLWQGAQRMLAEKPVLGFGPSGYREAAVGYLAPEALQYGPDVVGNTDPTVYSPQSPHSLFWEAATRLGIAGLLALGALGALWALTLRDRLRDADDPLDGLRVAMAAGFVSALFALMFNPVVFPIGLLVAALPGLAIATPAPRKGTPPAPGRAALALVAAGVAVAVVAVWLFVGEWRAFSAPADDIPGAVASYEQSLAVTPGAPMPLRRMLEDRLLLAADDASVHEAQAAVDAAPAYMLRFAPNAVNFAAYSLTQADRTGRTDVAWERALLDRASRELPAIPSLVAERLHLAVISGDAAEIGAALPLARQWGRPYPLTDSYIARAEQLLGESGN